MKALGFFIYFNSALGAIASLAAGMMFFCTMGSILYVVLSIIACNVFLFCGWGGMRMSNGDPFLVWKKENS